MDSITSSPIQVFVRCKPSSNHLANSSFSRKIININKNRDDITVDHDKVFHFDQVFDEATSQEIVYNSTSHALVENCFQGYNATIFAYGQTVRFDT